jgi:hypothetical protein
VGYIIWECGVEATFALIDWIGESDVVCETEGLDRYKRHLAHCTVEGEDLAVWLAESGWLYRSEIASAKPWKRHQLVRKKKSAACGLSICIAMGVAGRTLNNQRRACVRADWRHVQLPHDVVRLPRGVYVLTTVN